MFAFAIGQIILQIELNKIEAARWDKLSSEQKLIELRQREVLALERIARATENTRSHIYHHIF